ncbi:GlxA family transcriptional regulator [Streptomyces sp. 7-21]|uniref:GlxA family transcriptional regulator n=1 Tax=Streptomyces sp. 7-21 TaxID=2802283 RepID=UPI00191E6FD8|nr:helix-turn-helix domain-containing protein [Streptomyces sp. 7-21]MBL1068228.1 helix-turn-helix domain-containing protein [Streptomyces sp. 7-21]
MAIRRVAAYAPPGVAHMALGVLSGVFRRRPGLPPFELVLCARRPGPVRTDLRLPMHVEAGLDALDGADLVLVLPTLDFREAEEHEDVHAALRRAHARGAVVATFCTGTFMMAAAGLLDGLTATTHWAFADELAARYPRVTVNPEPLYIDHGNLVTGSGAASGTDVALHLVRRDHGATTANAIARDLVTPPHREGGQRQFITTPVPAARDDEALSAVLAWARGQLHRRVSVDELAARCLMSRRTFTRRFRAATGTTPHAWLRAQRLARAAELLETTDLTVEQIAAQVGYAGGAELREQFTRYRGLPPSRYRSAFSARRPAAVG